MQEHLNLIEALKKRDPQEVVQRLAYHINSAQQRVLGQDRRPLAPVELGLVRAPS
jgi:DNA-binding GntR family transcriptional regulator